MAGERSEQLRTLVLSACEDLGTHGLQTTPDAIAAVSALIVNASRLGAEVDAAAEIARLTAELDAARERERRYRKALERVADGGCERFYVGDCWSAGYNPDRVCDPCFARRALAPEAADAP